MSVLYDLPWCWGSVGLCAVQVAGTEQGITEPEATFSACFGGAFLLWHPMKYASMLAEKMDQHGTNAWLVNTGWTGGRSVNSSPRLAA